MPQLPTGLPFDRWLDYLFGVPVGPSGFRESDEWWDEAADPALTVAYLTQLFEGADGLLGRYPQPQIDRGLWFLAGESGHLQPMFVDTVTWNERRRALLAMVDLYRGLFLPACTNYLGHLDAGPEAPAPLNSSCYMWWDLFPTWGGGDGALHQRDVGWGKSRQARRRGARLAADQRTTGAGLHTVDDTILDVLGRILRLNSEACREAALHGLGHWHLHYPTQAAAIVDGWLATAPAISIELRRYAANARAGCVL